VAGCSREALAFIVVLSKLYGSNDGFRELVERFLESCRSGSCDESLAEEVVRWVEKLLFVVSWVGEDGKLRREPLLNLDFIVGWTGIELPEEERARLLDEAKSCLDALTSPGGSNEDVVRG